MERSFICVLFESKWGKTKTTTSPRVLRCSYRHIYKSLLLRKMHSFYEGESKQNSSNGSLACFFFSKRERPNLRNISVKIKWFVLAWLWTTSWMCVCGRRQVWLSFCSCDYRYWLMRACFFITAIHHAVSAKTMRLLFLHNRRIALIFLIYFLLIQCVTFTHSNKVFLQEKLIENQIESSTLWQRMHLYME